MKARVALGIVTIVSVTSVAGAVATHSPSSRPLRTTETAASVGLHAAAGTVRPPAGPIEAPKAVSISNPSPEAADAMAKCHIGDMIVPENVSGMAELGSPSEILRYVPLTGREPQLKETGAVWVIQIKGDVQQRGGEIWRDPTCVVTASDFGYFATGPVTDIETGKVTEPEPPGFVPDLALPPLAP